MTSSPLRRLPSVDAVLRHPDVAALAGALPRPLLADLVRDELAQARERVRDHPDGPAPDVGLVVSGVLRRAALAGRLSLRRVINATGVVLHTNLGRAPLSAAAVAAMAEVAGGYSNLEYDLETGQRGSRHGHVEGLICRLTGAPAAVVVNNNAAAVLLVLAELAAGREVVVSRGQAVEIGGGFRIPDVLRQSGARLVEVGTTNRTRLADYAGAAGPQTGAFLLVHASNFRIVGFTEGVVRRRAVRPGPGAGHPGRRRPGQRLPAADGALRGPPGPARAPGAGVRRRRGRPGLLLRGQAPGGPPVRDHRRAGRISSPASSGTPSPAPCARTRSPWPAWRPPCATTSRRRRSGRCRCGG